MDKQTDNFLHYTDGRLLITGQIVKHNNRLHLRFTSRGVSSLDQESVQMIPVELLNNFDLCMFNVVFQLKRL